MPLLVKLSIKSIPKNAVEVFYVFGRSSPVGVSEKLAERYNYAICPFG